MMRCEAEQPKYFSMSSAVPPGFLISAIQDRKFRTCKFKISRFAIEINKQFL